MITYANWRHRCSSFVALWPEPFLEVDSAGTVIEWNPRAEEVFGWLRHEVVGRPVADTLLPDGLDQAFLGAGSELTGLLDPLRTGAANGLHRRFEVVHGEGHRVAVDARLFVTGQGPARGLGGFVRPALSPAATGLDPAAGPWRDRARREDLLTGLPNRVHFGERLAAAVTDSQGVPGSVAVVLIDLDRFKTINNTMGHDFGDLVLASVASRLLKVAGDADLVARFGGDEFLALFTNGAGNAHMDASAFIDRVRCELATRRQGPQGQLGTPVPDGARAIREGQRANTAVRRIDILPTRARPGGEGPPAQRTAVEQKCDQAVRGGHE